MFDMRAVFVVFAALQLNGCLRLDTPAAAGKDDIQTQPAGASRPSTVGALGHFVPKNGLLRIAAPYYESRPSVVFHLAVHEGQTVERGQLIAVLDGKPQVEAERLRAIAQIDLARDRLAQVRAGTKQSDREAQRAEIRRLEAAHRLDELQLSRYERLYESKDVSASALDAQRAAEQASRQNIEAARQRLTSVIDVRPEDIRVLESELAVAQAHLREIETRVAALSVVAPTSGMIVKIHAREGEQPGTAGIVEMADVSQMEVEAEVYGSDLARVRTGQHAVVRPEEGGAEMTGEVVRIGAEVRPATVLSGDPVTFNDARVVPIRIRIPGCKDAACPINGRVRVTIETPGSAK